MRKQSKRKSIVILAVVVIAAGLGLYTYVQHATSVRSVQGAYEKGLSKYAENMKFSGEPISYKVRNGYCEGVFEGETENVFVTSKKELQSCLSQYGTVYIGEMYEDEKHRKAEEYFDDTFFQKHTLAIEVHDGGNTNEHYCLDSVTLIEDEANINVNYTQYQYGGALAPHLEFNFYILDKAVSGAKFNFKITYVGNTEDEDMCYKPVIYLYPEKEQKVDVLLGKKENLTCSYPKYKNGWHVLASPNGTLEDLETGKKLYSLYYENMNAIDFSVASDGFVVKGEDVAEFLGEKLEILGLNYREAEEFIIYWLPELEKNTYNYIRFATMEEIEKNMPLFVSGNPDTVLRVLMEYQPLEEPIKVKEQKINAPKREGFTVVEWGGTKLKEDR